MNRTTNKTTQLMLALLVLTACTDSEGPTIQSGGAANAINVVTAAAVVKPMGVEIEAVGTAHANESVEITSKISNKITAIRFEEGDFVRKGEILVELDSAEAKASLAEAEAALADSESQFRRSRELFAQQALSLAQLDQIESALKANRARVQAAQARLADTVIRAGFNGRTGFRHASVGSLVSPGTVITTLDDATLIKLEFTVPATYLYLLKKGLPVTAQASGLPGEAFEGKVTNLDSRVDPVTRSIAVRAEIPNPEGVLRPGMFMTVSLQGNVTQTLLVPEAAIVPEQGSTFVFVASDGVVQRREVKLGRRRPGEVEITSGLQEHERVVVDGTQNIRDGDRVMEQPLDTPATLS